MYSVETVKAPQRVKPPLYEVLFALALIALCAVLLSLAASPALAAGDGERFCQKGVLTVNQGLAYVGVFGPLQLTGALAPAALACVDVDITLQGMAVDGGFEVSHLTAVEPAQREGVTHLAGTLRFDDEGYFIIDERTFTATGPLAKALLYCVGLQVNLACLSEHSAEEFLVFAISLDEADESVETQPFVEEAISHFETMYPSEDQNSPQSTYARVKDVAVCPVTGKVKVVIESFGGPSQVWQGNEVNYRFDADGRLRLID